MHRPLLAVRNACTVYFVFANVCINVCEQVRTSWYAVADTLLVLCCIFLGCRDRRARQRAIDRKPSYRVAYSIKDCRNHEVGEVVQGETIFRRHSSACATQDQMTSDCCSSNRVTIFAWGLQRTRSQSVLCWARLLGLNALSYE